VALSHLIACGWYAVGTSAIESDNWVVEDIPVGLGLVYSYATSLHWSLCQLAGGMDEVRPHNTGERVYAIAAFLLCFTVAAVTVSRLTASMTQLHMLTSHQSRQLSVLRKYLSQNGISDRLALRVQRNVKHALAEKQRRLPESHIELLPEVSEPLMMDIHFEMNAAVLSVHPFFSRLCWVYPQTMRKVCHRAVSKSSISSGDVIFSTGEVPECPKLYIITEGTFEYAHVNGEMVQLQAGRWLAEGVLWTSWMHRGELKAVTDGQLCLVDAKIFQETVIAFDMQAGGFNPVNRAADFVQELNRRRGDITDIGDIDGPGSQPSRISSQRTSTFDS